MRVESEVEMPHDVEVERRGHPWPSVRDSGPIVGRAEEPRHRRLRVKVLAFTGAILSLGFGVLVTLNIRHETQALVASHRDAGRLLAGSILSSVESGMLTASGSTTNVAARIAGVSRGDEILVGPETARRIQGHYALVDVGEHRMRNVSLPVRVFRLRARATSRHDNP